jgi:hypothetical protein
MQVDPNDAELIDDGEAELDADVELEVPAESVESPETDATTEEPAAEELVVTIGDEAQPDPADAKDAPAWIRDVRKQWRETTKENKALRRELEALKTPKAAGLPAKPKLEDCDYDSDKYEAALDEWHKKKSEADAEKRAAEQREADDQAAWNARLAAHEKASKELPVSDYEDAQETVFSSLDQTQQGIILQGSDNSALLIYALGRNPAKLQSLAAIKDPVRYAFAIAKLETQLKTSKRRPTTAPESTVTRGSAGKPTTSAAGLEKLRAEAAKTGDYTKVTAYKRQLRQAAK